MSKAKAFIDSNVLLYLLSADELKADHAEAIVQAGGVISVQVLNEIANVARRKLAMSWPETHEFLAVIHDLLDTKPLTVEIHHKGLEIAERYGFSLYDSMIVTSALIAGCTVLYSEDLQDGQLIDDQLRLRNPFARKT